MHARILLALILVTALGSCKPKTALTPIPKTPAQYVNTFIGTGGHGHTYPGATMPFGMMQLGPDTRLDGWDGCSGYHYSDSLVYGFSHTHLSGTGVSDYGDVLLMPSTKTILNNGANGEPGYRSKFSHAKEKASPGYYEVYLEDPKVRVRLTVKERSGIHEYNYESAQNQYLIVDLEHRDELLDHDMVMESATELSGYRHSKAWAANQQLFYYIKFSKPVENWEQHYDSIPTKRALTFINPNNEPVYVRIGISPVDVAGARRNLETEIGNASFETVKDEATAVWEKQLSKISIEDDDEDAKTTFYTALYHTMIAPNLYQDVDGRYRGMDLEIHQTQDFNYYTVFSLWDTYRAAHPLYTIIEQERTNDFINTFNAKFDEGGILPIWDLSGNYTGCMIGYHAVPVIADAYLKGIRNYDVNKAFKAMQHSAMQDKLGLATYKETGFIPVEKESESVSKTLEYAYDDWTIAQMAKKLDSTEVYKKYIARAQNYKNIHNPESGFMQGRIRNTWFGPFDPYEVNFNYTEANAWQYSLYAPQDITGLMELMGGTVIFENYLDMMFTTQSTTAGREQPDISGLIGQYAHGNEPSHHMAYLYNYIGKPAKTQEKVHQILTTLYKNAPDGISGNEDCGQMSAWYVLSSMGFYPVTPGSNDYVIGIPLFKKATINLENGKTFTISKEGAGNYIASAKANSTTYTKTFITHEMIMKGGTLAFTMSEKPTLWGTKMTDVPVSSITDNLITAAPFIATGNIAFPDSTVISLKTVTKNALIYYTINSGKTHLYERPFTIKDAVALTTYAIKDSVQSKSITTTFYKYDANRSVSLKHSYANEYSAGGNNALIDGMTGTQDFRSGSWQGTQNAFLDATVDLGRTTRIYYADVSFLKDQRSWIFFPTQVTLEFLDENKKILRSQTQELPVPINEDGTSTQTVTIKLPARVAARYVRMTAIPQGKLPTWHLGFPYGGTAWTFVDELTIK